MISRRRILPLLAAAVAVACSPQVKDCKDAVKLHLTSPTSAVWSDVKTDHVASTHVEVRGTVDSDNAFGASLRSYFLCRLEAGKPIRVAIRRQPFDDFHTRLKTGRELLDDEWF